MNKNRQIALIQIIIILILLLAKINIAQEQSLKPLIEQLMKNYQNLRYINSTIEMGINRGDNFIFMKGKYYAGPEGKYKIEMRPTGDLIVIASNGKRQVFLIKRLNKAYVNEAKNDISVNKNMFEAPNLAKANVISDEFNLEVLKREEKAWKKIITLQAKPKISKEFISKIYIHIDETIKLFTKYEIYDLHDNLIQVVNFNDYKLFNNEVWFPVEMKYQYYEGKDNITVNVKFNDVKINEPIDDKLFEVEIPKDMKVEYIKPTQIY